MSRAAPRSSLVAPSDLRRGGALAAAAACSATVVLAWVLASGQERTATRRPLAGPHAAANLTCADCHGGREADAGGVACIRCHGAHPSTRPGHRALASRGDLPCASCHPAHDASGVSFDGDGRAGLWRRGSEARVEATGPRGATVPFVALAACRACHADGATDPLRACEAAGGGVSMCFDEHQTPTEPLEAHGVCAAQHGPSRFLAWEAAGAVARGTEPLRRLAPAGAGGGVPPWVFVMLGMGAGILGFAAASCRARAWRPRRSPPAPQAAPERARLPVVDAGRCLGCQACVDACPFDVLAVGRYVAKVVRPDACCGVGACETACPNGSLRLLAEGEPLVDRPRVDSRLESLDAPGVYLAGDLTGLPLIRNAIVQGAAVADRVAERMPRSHRSRDPSQSLDLAVVGAGPAGLSAALRARELGLACAVFEQATMAATLRAFPRGKIVHDPPLELPLEGALWLRESTKEELLAQWTRIVRTHRLDVRERHRAAGVTRTATGMELRLETPEGATSVRAAHVLLAVGRRGTPRALEADIAPGASARVVTSLSDARALAGQRVLVVGLGDSAMEAIIAVARQAGSEVTASYRGANFARGRARNIEQVRRLAASGRIRVHFRSVVKRVDEQGAVLETPEGTLRVAADVVLALLGGRAPRALLEACGVRVG